MSVKCGMRNSGSGIAAPGGAAARSAAGVARRVKFGDVVREVKDKIDRADNPYEFYVAGDHMDTEDLKIRRRGRFATDDVGPAFTRVFKPGQILYGSRRTYLKKVCVADFEGITANTTFVLETKDENVLLQRLLPFLMLGDRFTAWSIKHSKGSTNPYVLFGDLADYEFDLPPMDEQKKLAELLWAANDLKESYKKAITATDEMLKAKFREMFGDAGDDSSRGGAETRSKWPMKEVRELAENISAGKDVPEDFVKEKDDQHTIPIFSNSIEANGLYGYAKTPRILVPSITITARGTIGFVCKREEPYVPIIRLIVFVPKQSMIDLSYATYALQGSCKAGGVTSIPQLTVPAFSKIQIPLPPLSLQREFVAIADKAESAKANLKKSIAAIDQVMKGLING